jgi:hypothetical protein
MVVRCVYDRFLITGAGDRLGFRSLAHTYPTAPHHKLPALNKYPTLAPDLFLSGRTS